jgi:5-methylcytosine-specific restriction endonuclease McrA
MAFRIKNWAKFQHFKDRRPPWVKLHRELLDDQGFNELAPMSCKVLVLLWLIASESLEGHITSDSEKLAFRLRLPEKQVQSAIDDLLSAGFLLDAEEEDEPDARSTAKSFAAANGFGSRHISDSVKREVWERDGGKCVFCGSEDSIEYDHKHPVSKGGNSEASNIQLLCRPCNRKKRTKTAEQLGTHAQPGLDTRTTETEAEKRQRERQKRADDFKTFYAAYPKKRAPADAEKAFAKVDVDLAILLNAISEQSASQDWRKEGGRYIPYPATWLNQRQWENVTVAAITVAPAHTGPDPALEKIKRDAAMAAPMPAEIRAQLAEAMKGKVH